MVTKDLAYEQIEQLGARFHEQFQFVIQQQMIIILKSGSKKWISGQEDALKWSCSINTNILLEIKW